MNVFNKVALQGLKKNHTRTFVTIIGVMLSAALITAVSTFGISLLTYLKNGSIQKNGDWQIEFTDKDYAFIEEQADNHNVEKTASFENIGYALLNGGQNPDKPYLFISGFHKETFDTLPIQLISGRLPENSSEIIIPTHVATNGGVKLNAGDILDLSVGIRQADNRTLSQLDPYSEGETLIPSAERVYTVVGTYRRPSFEKETFPGYTAITAADESEQTDSCSVFVTLKNPFLLHSYTNRTATDHAFTLNDDVLRFMGLSSDKLFTTLLFSIGAIVMIIIMTGSVFLIYNAFHISLNERTHQFGILMSVGATEKQLRNSVLFEGLIIGVAGTPIGIIAGLGSMGFVLRVVSKKFESILYDNVPLALTISIPVILAAAFISLITILISAYIPARKAARTPVMECIRQTNEVKLESKSVKTSRITSRIYGLEGTLALKNFKRNKRRYRSIILSLVLSVTLFVTVNAFVMDLKQASNATSESTTYDIALDTHEMTDDEMLPLYDKLKTVDGVYESSYQEILSYTCTAAKGDLSDAFKKIINLSPQDETVSLKMNLQLLDDSTYLKLVNKAGLPEDQYTGDNARLLAVSKLTGSGGQSIEEIADVFHDSTINLTASPLTDDAAAFPQNLNLTLINLITPDSVPNVTEKQAEKSSYHFVVLAPYSMKAKFDVPGTHVSSKGLTFCSKTPTLSAKKMDAILSAENTTAGYQLWNTSKILDDNNNMIFIANVFAYTFVVIISLIAVANVFNTISTNIKMRKRELAMLRSVGMSDQDFQKMMNFECIFYGMRALLYGIPVSILFSWLIYKGMAGGGADEIKFVLPWGSMAISVVGVLLIVFITMLYSISKIKKENIIDSLRDEMI